MSAEAEIERLQQKNAVLREQRNERGRTAEVLGQINDQLRADLKAQRELYRHDAAQWHDENERLRAELAAERERYVQMVEGFREVFALSAGRHRLQPQLGQPQHEEE